MGPVISEQEAIARAKKVAQEQGWAWADPALATYRAAWFGKGGKWEIFSNAHGKGAMARVVIDAETGAVLDKGYIPR
jgi:hypothetical protein